MDLKSLENQRLYIFKRLGILKFLSIIEALLIAFLAFVFIKDALIAIILAIFVGVFFFRFTSKKLNFAKKELELNALNLFLRRFGGRLKKESLSQEDFLKLELIQNLKEFKSQNCFDFKDFKIYDIQYLDENKRLFCGILLEILKANKNIKFEDQEQIYIKVQNKNFTLDHIFSKQNYYLIATLSNPFFIDLKKDLANNFTILEHNLNSIKNKFF
ncbi:poly(A) polymerase [Campylobacter sp. VicNov18]|uniref:poly(A) polymerase n=1 Tax=Campylobacter bilis TaxID=2691918 RepID=UPI00130DE040|nr:poly(A) polymerase [Campylobacter bilis]MPV63085.1 poly(A) polymerase [Campylobacter hepaticus]MBM0636584.1 poly(A) polymerase [Campylobacter bilis]MCC8277292.1 poly(A) polymerase [Campylobacter bilis]MCC8299035.1 poly(A) polymerase [Campylobacter bilis]MCC8300201.1 poly(A) polymerase [Campylobacter bilis]